MHLLSRRVNDTQIGATKEEIVNMLDYKGKTESQDFYSTLTNLSKYLKPLGLYIKYNPLDKHWFLSYDLETSNLLRSNPFENKPKLAATLLCAIICCISNSGTANVEEIKKLRKKQGVRNDLKDLAQKGYIELINDSKKVRLTSLIGYQLDFEKLFVNLSLKIKNEKKND